MWGLLDKQALENCLGVVLLAQSLVLAGTGHLQTFKLIRGAVTRFWHVTVSCVGAAPFMADAGQLAWVGRLGCSAQAEAARPALLP